MHFGYPVVIYIIFKNYLLDFPGFDAKRYEKKSFLFHFRNSAIIKGAHKMI